MVERIVPGVNRHYGEGSAALRQHLARYRIACAYIRVGDRVLDAACGAGYGSFLLAEAGARVLGVDRDSEALDHARTTYDHSRIKWLQADLEGPLDLDDRFDRIVCFETIEHVRSASALVKRLASLLSPRGLLICSVPIVPTMHFDPFHLRDFTDETFLNLLTDTGFIPLDRYSQEDTFLTLIGSFTDAPDLESQPVEPKSIAKHAP